ncbi:MAG: tRNA lysidine(34) synthetase TilS, partial [Clostridia bacterium]|nr:tRNA lysidine(34) synthetase TilS [Clostridia bacterium]
VCRRLRYAALRRELALWGLGVIATAHHATDQLETVLHRMLRGGGARALVGIRPVHGDLVRPLLSLTKGEIEEALRSSHIPFETDSTNFDKTYTRNYLRAEVLPRLSRVVPHPERAVMRMTEALSHDAALLDELAKEALSAAPREGKGVSAEYLRSLPEALRRRLLVLLYEEARDEAAAEVAIEHTHVVTLSRLLLSGRGRFSLAVPNRLFGRLSNGEFSFVRLPQREMAEGEVVTPIGMGENRLPGDFTLSLFCEGETLFARCSSILNKIDITAAISPAIIKGKLYVRTRREGDAYFFRGHTHSLKKLYNEMRIPLELRATLPLLCDDGGILWMPFCPVRERSTGKSE